MTISTDQLRERFLRFFASRNHKIYPSASLVPTDDASLLFTSAGMNQFKQEFLGQPAEFRRAASCQKCLRTADLERVGKSSAHHTFFEKLGNFSFGDYFKQEAIALAWEFLTRELRLAEDKLWVSVYRDDQEAFDIWHKKIGIDKKRIVRLGSSENFWPANAPEDGPNGPCGPCSEIFYDRGKEFGCRKPECSAACGCGRFAEIWNLVFTQFERKGKNNLLPLPNKNIDTGMGLERMAAVLQGKPNNFEIDIFKPIVDEIERMAGRSPNRNTAYTIADHIRAVTFAIADGVLPSNDQRGYVIRKLVRRSVWQARALGIKKPFLHKIVPKVAKAMKAAYPALEARREEIAQAVKSEEERFQNILEQGNKLAKDASSDIYKIYAKGRLSGKDAFKLYDTYGWPLELIEQIAAVRGVGLDKKGFERELELQRKLSRKKAGFAQTVFSETLVSRFKLPASEFVGDKTLNSKGRVTHLFKDEQPVEQAKAGEKVKIILDSSPFYGESGGQVGDSGLLTGPGLEVKVLDTKRIERTIIHIAEIEKGRLKLSDKLQAQVDVQRRQDIARNHTATHLLQAALRKALGKHIRQSGSWVGAERLRFDFTHFQKLTPRQLSRVEELINQAINRDIKLQAMQMGFKQAKDMGALAFFTEKYRDKVRVVKIGDTSLELCGGTHVASLREIGRFKIISESSLASGVRRIEAVTGRKARKIREKDLKQLSALSREFGKEQKGLPAHLEQLAERLKSLDKGLERARVHDFKTGIDTILAGAQQVGRTKIIIRREKSAQMQLLRLMADLLRQKAASAVIVLASAGSEKVFMVCAVTKDLCAGNVNAAKIIRTLAALVQGSGGGRPDFAQAGGKNPRGLKKALEKAEEIISKELKQCR